MSAENTARAERVIARCREIARCTEVPGETTRLFLSPSMHDVHALLRGWMEAAGMQVRVDAIGNLRGLYAGADHGAPVLLMASHLDTAPNAGAFDGVLGVVMGVAIIEALAGKRLPFGIEVIGFSEEEGVRFRKPFLGSLFLTGGLDTEILDRVDDDGVSVKEAIEEFGLEPFSLHEASVTATAFGYFEVHIEQGPVLESERRSVAIVDAIAGQTRLQVMFTGQANHAGTTPMKLRHDALAAAAHWIVEVEQYAKSHAGLVATVGQIKVAPGAINVIAGEAEVSLDVRHALDEVRHTAVTAMLQKAEFAASSRGITLAATRLMEQAAVPMDAGLVELLKQAAAGAGFAAKVMTSGAGHDAMIVAGHVPSVMLFVRSPGGLSHHPDEAVLAEDVEVALATSMEFLSLLRGDAGKVSSGNEDLRA